MSQRPPEPTNLQVDPDDLENNSSANAHISDVLAARLQRRHVLKNGVGAMAAAGLTTLGLSACGGGGSDAPPPPPPAPPPPAPEKTLSFTAVPKTLADQVTVPAGYTATVLYATGDSIDPAVPAYVNGGTNDNFGRRSGDHHDGMQYFGLSATGNTRDNSNSNRGLLVMNHENIAGTVQFIHPQGQTNASSGARPEAEAIREIEAHGVSIIEINRSGTQFALNQASALNRRITARTPMALNGPVGATAAVKTKYSPGGTQTRGTINNCANGYTPWGTYLTCEENWAGYFQRATGDNTARTTLDATRGAKEITSLRRVGLNEGQAGNNRWTSVVPADATSTEYSRWNTSVTGTSADGSDDFRNVANTYGWVVEIDPFDGAAIPRKRTALGRFAHEGAWPSNPVVGQPLAFYMGDDSRGEYIYKFVTAAVWDAADANKGISAGDKYLDAGTLYAARFNADGTGTWLRLDLSNTDIKNATAPYAFADLPDVLINARLAADAAGATKMDRPEWTAVNPTTGEVYVTCTENPDRGNVGTTSSNNLANPDLDAANPRYWLDNRSNTTGGTGVTAQRGNVNGHIMRFKETGENAAGLSFKWDIFLFGAQSNADAGLDDTNYQANVNLSGLTGVNDLSKPDGCWFSRASGILWIETDDNTYTDVTNCMLLAAIPGSQGDGSQVTVVNKANGKPGTAGTADKNVVTYAGKKLGDTKFRRFLTAPRGAEVTGLAESPDGKVLFINIQHPGENTGSQLTETGAATVAVTAASQAGPFESNWPGNGRGTAAYGPGGTGARPRSATVMITKNDGGIIGL